MAQPDVFVRIDGAWVPVGGGGGAPAGEEVVVGGAQPTDPVTELWYDEADTSTGGIDLEAMPRGYVAHAGASGAQSVGATEADIPGCQVTFNAEPTRLYKLSVSANRVDQTVATGDVRLRIRNVGDGTDPVVISQMVESGWAQSLNAWNIVGGMSGSVTLKATLQALGGTTNTIVGFLPLIAVEDIGGV